MKGKKIVVPVILLIGLFLLLFWKSSKFQQAKVSIENPEKISQIQLRTARILREAYSSTKLDNLLKCLEKTVPVESEEKSGLERNEDFTSVLLIYEDGSKDKFFFFEDNGKWYMETDEGIFYENAEFIEDYAVPQKPQESSPAELLVNEEILDIYLTLLKKHETVDVEFEVLYHMAAYEKAGFSKEDAILKTEQKLTERWKLFDYAKRNGFFLSEDEQNKLVEEYVSNIQAADNYEEYNKICLQSGFSLEDIIRKMKVSILENEISSRFYHARELEFMEGNDTVNGQICENMNEYYKMFLQAYVYGEEQESQEYESFLIELENVLSVYRQADE